MKIGIACGVAVVALLVAGSAGAAGITLTKGPTISDCGGQAVEPVLMTLACGDGNFGISGMTWSNWGAAKASGTGIARVNDCTPDCAAGMFHTYPIVATPSAIQTCLSGRKQYTQIVITYTSEHPKSGGATYSLALPCDAPGPGPTITAKPATKGQLTLTGVGWQRTVGCTSTVAVGFRDKTTPFASPKVGKGFGFRITLVDVRAGSVIVARQTCTSPAIGDRLYESAITVK